MERTATRPPIALIDCAKELDTSKSGEVEQWKLANLRLRQFPFDLQCRDQSRSNEASGERHSIEATMLRYRYFPEDNRRLNLVLVAPQAWNQEMANEF